MIWHYVLNVFKSILRKKSGCVRGWEKVEAQMCALMRYGLIDKVLVSESDKGAKLDKAEISWNLRYFQMVWERILKAAWFCWITQQGTRDPWSGQAD